MWTLPIRFLLLCSDGDDRSLWPVSSSVLVLGRAELVASLAAVTVCAWCPLLRLPLRPSIPEPSTPFRLLGGLLCPTRPSRSHSRSRPSRLVLFLGAAAGPPTIVVVVPSAICDVAGMNARSKLVVPRSSTSGLSSWLASVSTTCSGVTVLMDCLSPPVVSPLLCLLGVACAWLACLPASLSSFNHSSYRFASFRLRSCVHRCRPLVFIAGPYLFRLTVTYSGLQPPPAAQSLHRTWRLQSP